MAKSAADPAAEPMKEGGAAARQPTGILGRLRRLFAGSEDFEKELRHLSKEEASVHARMKGRAKSSRRMTRNIIVLSVAVEVVAVAYAILTTRSIDLNWQMRALRVLPMFSLPVLSFVIYTALVSFIRMLDRKDQTSLERLRAERQAKIDELKERTNYYNTQQLIQRYDLDPSAKAAAATVLASKLGADSGLKVYVGDESSFNDAQANGLRKRKLTHSRSFSDGSIVVAPNIDEALNEFGGDDHEAAAQNQKAFEHYQGSNPSSGGLIAKIAALLVGEDPTQCYALICGNCHMHNGLARKEDFLYITYYCPHCHALNGSGQAEELESGSSSSKVIPATAISRGNASDGAGSISSVSGVALLGNLATVDLSPEASKEEAAGRAS